MPSCSQCGEEHDLLDPVFYRPDAYVELDPEQCEDWARSDDDLCRIALPDRPLRNFVRCVLPVEVEGLDEGIAWGLWAEVNDASFERIVERWADDDQDQEPMIDGVLANDVPGADTLSLPVKVQLTGPDTRPHIQFAPELDHAFANICRRGVHLHQAAQWIALLDGPAVSNDFDQANLATFVCQHVFDGELVRLASHDEEDGAWQFLCGGDHDDDDQPRLVGAGAMITRDPSLYELGELLEPGECAERDAADDPWRIGTLNG